MSERRAEREDSGVQGEPESRARTYLANERTFLSWVRTAVTLIALGLAAAQFLARNVVAGVPIVRAIAVGLVVAGLFLALAGTRRYFVGVREIEAQRLRPTRYSVLVVTALVVFVGLVSIAFILLLRGV